MKKTAENILDQALKLFNEKGTQAVTLRNIAQAAGISQGNLNYHFKTKSDIIQALYFRLVEQLNQVMGDSQVEHPTFMLLFQSGQKVMAEMYAHRYLMLDFVNIMRDHPAILAHYRQLQDMRQFQFLTLFDRMVAEGLMRPELFPGEYQRMYERMNILGDYWINAQLILHPDRNLDYYLQLFLEGLFPYLTAQGQAAFKALFGLGKA